MLARIREFPSCETPEDTMRQLLRGESPSTSDSDTDDGSKSGGSVKSAHRSTERAIRYLLDVVAKHGPFDAVVGYSEGAVMAATMLLWQQRKQRRGEPLFKLGVFFAGWPPVDPKTHDVVLADEAGERIRTRTVHVGE